MTILIVIMTVKFYNVGYEVKCKKISLIITIVTIRLILARL